MKWLIVLGITGVILFSCESKKVAQVPEKEAITETSTPLFSSEKLGISFPSQLSQDHLTRALIYAEQRMDSVVLLNLLPDCEIFDGEEQCRETTVLSSLEGDSLKREHLNNLDQIIIDADRFGERKTLKPQDIKKLLLVLFTGSEKKSVSFCYSPRHAIIIYGSDAKLSGFIEVCFECSESISILQSAEIPDLNQEALNGLGELFQAYGFDENKLN